MQNAYDEVPYENVPFVQALPRGHATVAMLHGLSPADPRTARVLELGCGAGANLAGVAAAHPEVHAVGIDLAGSAIEVARATAADAGLENVRFDVGDVLELQNGELGEFDYVIAHGLYGWVAEPVREAMLAACRSHLAPDGIAYASYTVHPGGHQRQMLREMAQWHARGVQDPREQAARAHNLFALLAGLAESGGAESFYAGVVGQDVHALANTPESVLVHDLLERDYAAVWFADFAAAAARHGLAYVGDAIPASNREPPLSEAVEAFVAAGAGDDRIAREQYLDILVLRRFRHSLLCRDELAPSARVDPAVLPRLLVAPDGEATEPAPEPLGAALDGARRPVPFTELRERTGVPDEQLAAQLVTAFDAGQVEFHAVSPPAAAAPGERPRASALARSQAQSGARVTTLLQQLVRITDEPTAHLLRMLDGTRDRDAIREEFPAPLDAPSLEAALDAFAGRGLLHE